MGRSTKVLRLFFSFAARMARKASATLPSNLKGRPSGPDKKQRDGESGLDTSAAVSIIPIVQEYAYIHDEDDIPAPLLEVPFLEAFSKDHLDQVLHASAFIECEPGDVIIAEGDEVLDWREMRDRYADCAMRVLPRDAPGSDHALSRFELQMPEVLAFAGLSAR